MRVDTPCIGICSSVYGDAICRGCKRTALEVIEWNRYTTDEKEAIYQRLASQISATLLAYIEIFDSLLLQEKIMQRNIPLHAKASSIEQAFHLLRLGSHQIKNLENYGMRVKTEFAQLPLNVLFNHIDEKIYKQAVKNVN